MRLVLVLLSLACGVAAEAQPVGLPPIQEGKLCATLLDARRAAESEGRLDFSAAVQVEGVPEPIARMEMGSPYAVGRIHFAGHHGVNDSTLRGAMTLREREVFDVGELRRSLARLNQLGFAAPLSLADVVVTRHPDRATADVTLPLRGHRRRWWSLSGPLIPGLGAYEASVSSRLPSWGRGIVDASTYVVSVNLLGFAKPLFGLLPLLFTSPPAVVAVERPLVPGQEFFSGFALSPGLSARTTLARYGRTQLGRGLRAWLEPERDDPLAVPIVVNTGQAGDHLVCTPAKPRWWWLRRGVVHAADLTLAALLP